MKQVDKNFRDKLGHHESDVPADMWDRIAPALEQETKRARPIFWLSFLAGLVIFGLVSSFYLSNSSGQDGDSMELTSSDMAIPLAFKAETKNIQSEYTSDLSSITEAKNVFNEFGNAEQTSNVNSVSGNLTGESEENKTTNNKILQEDVLTDKVQLSNTSIEHTNTIRESDPSTQSKKPVRLVITKSYFDGDEKVSDVNTTLTIGKDSRTLIELNKLSTQVDMLNNSSNRIESINGLFGNKAPQCPTFIDKRVGFFIDGYISHNLTNNNFSGDSEYAALRSETELAQYSFGAGLRASYFLGKGFGIRSGIAYNQINTKLEFDDPSAWRIRITTQIIKEIDSEGNEVEIEREVEEIVQGRSIINHNNKYRFVEMPVLAFYEFGSSKSPFYYSVNAGVNINLLFSQEGRYVNSSKTVSAYKGDDEYPNPYRTNAGVSLYTSFGIHYVLNDNIDIVFEPHFSTQLSNITNSNSLLNQRFTTFGVNTGVRYKF